MESKQFLFQLSKELTKPVRKNFPRLKVSGIDQVGDTIGQDILDLTWAEPHNKPDQNKGYKMILVIEDIFSRYCWLRALKSKEGKEVFDAFMSVRRGPELSGISIYKIWNDQGKEFYNKHFNKYCRDNNIVMYSTHSEIKNPFVERLNRTLMGIIWRHWIKNNNRVWYNKLDEIAEEYNTRRHRVIRDTPARVFTLGFIPYIEDKIRNKFKTKEIEYNPKFKKGDKVRISRAKGIFEKGYDTNWSQAIYIIDKVRKTIPPTYNIKDHAGNAIAGVFYEQDLQKTKLGDIVLIEKVLKRRKYRGNEQSLVKYLGYSDEFNQWRDDEDLYKV